MALLDEECVFTIQFPSKECNCLKWREKEKTENKWGNTGTSEKYAWKGFKPTARSEKKKRNLEEEYGCHLAPGISCASQSKEGLVVEHLQDQYVWIKNSSQKKKSRWNGVRNTHNRLLRVQKGSSREFNSKYVLVGLTMHHELRNLVCTTPVSVTKTKHRKEHKTSEKSSESRLCFCKMTET